MATMPSARLADPAAIARAHLAPPQCVGTDAAPSVRAETQCAGTRSRINPGRPHIQCVGNSTGLLAPCAHYVPLADASLARVDGKGTCLSRVVVAATVGG